MAKLPVGSGWHLKRARMVTATVAVMQNAGGRGEMMMKADAPWTDRTALARGGLFTTVEVANTPALTRIVLWFSHTQDYGKWLETVNGPAMGQRASMSTTELAKPENVGNYAVIHPTIDKILPDIRAAILRIWS